jgi:uncharacterized repeat protein (TIGR02543 family)
VGWSDAVSTASRSDTHVTGDITVMANFAIDTHTLTYNAGTGGTITGTSPQIVNYGADGTTVTATPIVGYHFVSWSDSVSTASRSDTHVTGDITVTASFAINQYTITFDSDGGSPVADITQAYGSTVTAPVDPTKAGYTFAGWNPAFPTTMPLGGASLTAQWTANQYTISFDSAGGSSVADITQAYGSTVTAPADPTKAGYTFAGWNPAVPATMPLGGASLTAQWTANQYTITFDSAGGSPVADITQAYGNTVTTPADPTKAGYTFAGWNPAIPTTMPLGGASLTAQWTANQYTITFDSAGGSSVADITQAYASPVTAPTDPTKAGYTFAGWNPAVPTTMPLGGVALTAHWTANQYTITFDSAGGSPVADITQDYGSAISAPADPTKTGYTFAGWNPTIPTTMPLGGTSLTAQWTINSYTVTFDANTGSGSMASETRPYNTLTALTINSFTKTGYSFRGWNAQANGGGTPYADGATYPFTANTTLYAQWSINSYTVTFDANTGSGSMASETEPYNTPSALTLNSFTKTGYSFSGWNTQANGGGAAYADGAAYPFTANTTLYAQWSINNYTVTFDANTGSGSMASETEPNNTATALTLNSFTKTGYSFSGWNAQANGGGTAYADGATYPFTANTTLYAQWSINSYTVTFDANTGSGTMTSETEPYNTSTALTLNSFIKTGYSFNGWNTLANDTGIAYADGAAYPFTASTTLYAQWTIKTYTLTYKAGAGGTIIGTTPQTVNYGANGTAVTAMPATGYHFVKWSDGLLTASRTDIHVTANISVTANFAINTYSLTYTAGPNGSITGITHQTVDYGANGTKVTAVPAAGYHFVKWSDGVLTASRTDTHVTANISVTASFAFTGTERTLNGGFNTYIGTSKIPQYWTASNFNANDGKDTTVHQEGTASVKITGTAGLTKTLTQTISLSGLAGNRFLFSFQVKGTSIPVAGLCQAQVKLYNGTILVSTQTVNCGNLTTLFQLKSLMFNAPKAYNKIVVVFTYTKSSGTVWFDAVSLLR